MSEMKKRYSLFTAVTMIVGIVIGSGIFFKTDNILAYTGGDVLLGAIVFCLAAISIIFGSLAISQLSARTERPGGIITYTEEFASPRLAAGLGWFQSFIYLPTIGVVVSWVTGIYMEILFGWQPMLERQILIGAAWCFLCFVYNTLSPRFGGIFQNLATVLKLLPLFMLAVAGLVWGNPGAAFANPTQINAAAGGIGFAWLAAIGPVAFSFDGWTIATSIAHEVKDSRRNMPRALVFSPIFVLIAYLMYFVGVSMYIGPEQVLALKDAAVDLMATSVFGAWGAKIVLVLIIVSVMGTVNGILMGLIRLPYSLALRDMLPGSAKLRRLNEKTSMPVASAVLVAVVCAVWWGIHYLTMKFGLLPNSDVSEISIVMNNFFLIVLYLQVLRLWRKGEIKGIWSGVIVPVLACVGAVFILVAGIQNPMFLYFVAICLAGSAAGYLYLGGRRSNKA